MMRADTQLVSPKPARRPYRPESVVRLLIVSMLACLIVAGTSLLFGTEQGRALLSEESRERAGRAAGAWVAEHTVVAPLCVIGAYVACSLLSLPVWWLQVLAGYGFGLVFGVAWCQAGAVSGAVTTVLVSRWLGASWFREKIEGRMHKLRALDETLGHNGLLVVLAMRLLPILPFGLTNYAIGLTRITIWPVVVGTWLGLIPIVTFYVAVGAEPWLLASHWFWIAWFAAHVVLLAPLAIKYFGRAGKGGTVAANDPAASSV